MSQLYLTVNIYSAEPLSFNFLLSQIQFYEYDNRVGNTCISVLRPFNIKAVINILQLVYHEILHPKNTQFTKWVNILHFSYTIKLYKCSCHNLPQILLACLSLI